jgi:NADH-quinone oxidoreductase subunit J
MVPEVPNLPSGRRLQMWIGKEELLTWNPQRDVAKPYPPKNPPLSRGGRGGWDGVRVEASPGPSRCRPPLEGAGVRPADLGFHASSAMIDTLLANLDTLLLYVFALCAFAGAALMIVLRQPMRVALALISTMIFLGGIYGLLGVHFIAAFQVLIYVGAVMVFMVYVIMLLDVRDPAVRRRYSKLLLPGLVAFALLIGVLAYAVWNALPAASRTAGSEGFGCSFSRTTFSTRTGCTSN